MKTTKNIEFYYGMIESVLHGKLWGLLTDKTHRDALIHDEEIAYNIKLSDTLFKKIIKEVYEEGIDLCQRKNSN